MYTSRTNNNGWIAGYANDGGRMYKFHVQIPCSSCHSHGDGSGIAPILNANASQCFLDRFASGDSYANCDSTGGLTANDSQCFLGRFAGGCP